MLNRFLKDSAVYSLASLLQKATGFVFLAIFSYLIAPEAFGIFDYIVLMSGIVILLVPLEISQALARFYTTAEKQSEKQLYASSSFWFTSGALSLFSLFTWLGSEWLGPWLFEGRDDAQNLLQFSVLFIASNGLIYMLQNQLRWELRPRAYSLLILLNSLSCGLFSVGLIMGAKQGLWGLFWGYLLGNTLTFICGLILARHSYSFQFSWDKVKEMLTYSLPLVPSGLGVFVALSIDRLLIKTLLNFYDLGLYGLAIRFSSTITLLISGIQLSLTPLIYHHYKDTETPGHVAKIFHGFWGGGLWVILSLSLGIEPVMWLFIDESYFAAARIIPILAAATLVSQLYIFAPGLGLFKKTKHIALINLVAALLNTLANYLLIPLIGLYGAALATLSVSVLSALVYFRFSQSYYTIPFNSRRIILMTLFIAFAAGGYLCTSSFLFIWRFILALSLWLLGSLVLYWGHRETVGEAIATLRVKLNAFVRNTNSV